MFNIQKQSISITLSLLDRCLISCYPGGDIIFKLSSIVGNGGYDLVNSNDKRAIFGQLDQLHALLLLSNERSVMVNYLVTGVQ
jgi:hypothetical protein